MTSATLFYSWTSLRWLCSSWACCTSVSVEGGSSPKWCLPCQGNITAVVFPKWLELSVINRTYSALTSFEIGLAYGSLLKPQKPCQSFTETLLKFQYSFKLPFWASLKTTSMVLAEFLCFFLFSSCVNIFILKFFITVRL